MIPKTRHVPDGYKKPKGKASYDEQLTDAIAEFYDDPLGYVLFMFPWDTDPSIQMVRLPEKYRERFPNSEWGPDLWACDFLDQWGEEIKKRGFNGRDPVPPIQFSTASGHGIGKSVMVSWIIKFICDTRPFCKGTVTATTADQLKARTWAELGKWHSLSMTKHWFDYQTTRGNMVLKHKEFGMRWFCQAQTCKEENSEAFAGQHAADSTSFYIFDEASGVPDKIYEVRQGGLRLGEPMSFDFGNPTKNTGYFYYNCDGKFAHRYIVRHIDSRDVAIMGQQMEAIKQMIEDYGPDSDVCKVRIYGQFPSSGDCQFISSELARLCMEREAPPIDRSAPRLISVDCGGEGANADETVIANRKGMDGKSFPPKRFKGLDQMQIAGKAAAEYDYFKSIGDEPTAIFVDGTGGYGGGVISLLRASGYPVIEIGFGRSAVDNLHYKYMVDEMWGGLREAMKSGFCIWDHEDVFGQLTERWFGYTVTMQIRLEPKPDMKKRGVQSPDIVDAYAMLFAVAQAPVKQLAQAGVRQVIAGVDYDPTANVGS